MSARTQITEREDSQIQSNVATIEAQKARPSAIQAMASRLNLTPGKLQETLMNTVFKGATNDEFAALIVVANELGLNPLKKEIYAFPSRGGVTPMIGYDGWISIANRHPEFDGCKQNDVYLEGKFVAVETIIYLKNRSHPIEKTIYLDEFKMNTDPWKQKPMHMTGMRSFCHAARLALGVSGVMVEDEIVIDGNYSEQPSVVPNARRLQQQQQSKPTHDPETGEIVDEEETARELDAQASAEARGLGDEEKPEYPATDNADPRRTMIDGWLEALVNADADRIRFVDREFVKHRAALSDELAGEVDAALVEARKGLGPK